MESILKTKHGELIHGDNIEVLKTLQPNSIDSCISDFPYDLKFMGKKWDNTGNFYNWCNERAIELYKVIKSGGYVCIFGHPKTNHRMKSAFEDVGFQIVEEVDWVYGTGFPKNQDVGKLFDKKAGVERKVIGKKNRNYHAEYKTVDENNQNGWGGNNGLKNMRFEEITEPSTDLAKKWNGWKTAGLKPAHEPITIFQKPLEGTYINNIEKYECGGMNIDVCRVPTSQEDKDIINAKSSKNENQNYSQKDDAIFGEYDKCYVKPANELGRFPANMIFDSFMGEALDSQSGILQSDNPNRKPRVKHATTEYSFGNGTKEGIITSGFTDKGGASRYFLNIDAEDFVPFLYCPKPTKKEKGEGNTHVTVKPKELIKWLIKLVTPINGTTIDITAGSGTHGLSCEELNRDNKYNLTWINIEMSNTEKEPYCEIAKNRIQKTVNNNK